MDPYTAFELCRPQVNIVNQTSDLSPYHYRVLSDVQLSACRLSERLFNKLSCRFSISWRIAVWLPNFLPRLGDGPGFGASR